MKSECMLCKGDYDFLLVFNSIDTSIMHRFRYHTVLPLTGNCVIMFSSLGGAAGSLSRWILNQVLPLLGNDVIVIYPLGGAADRF